MADSRCKPGVWTVSSLNSFRPYNTDSAFVSSLIQHGYHLYPPTISARNNVLRSVWSIQTSIRLVLATSL